MKRTFSRAAFAGLILSALAGPAFAHVTLQIGEAPVGGSYRAILQVPHGCGTEATNLVRIAIPQGFTNAKPMPKAGWELSTITDDTGNVTEVIWSGGNLPNEWYDEFVVHGSFSDDLEVGSTVYFPIIQECANGVERWIGQGEGSAESDNPAPGVTLVESTGGHH